MKINKLKVLSLIAASGLLFASCGGGSGSSESTDSKEMKEPKEEKAEMEEPEEEPAEEAQPEGEVVDISTGETNEVTIETPGATMAEMKFTVDQLIVSAGQEVTINLNNTGEGAAMQHNLVIVEDGNGQAVATAGIQEGPDNGYVPESPDVIASSELLKAGESTTVTFTIDEPGVYKYICTYPGHYPQMQGTITVK